MCGLRSAGWAGLWAEGRGPGWVGLGWAQLGLWAVSCGVRLGFLVGLGCLVQGWSEAGCGLGAVCWAGLDWTAPWAESATMLGRAPGCG